MQRLILILFIASELCYYLLIAQTGVVEYFSSNLFLIAPLPIGGVIGSLLVSYIKIDFRNKISLFLTIQLIMSFLYPNFNMIIGENNIGKSTLFEAIHLWMLGYNSLIQANGRNFYGRNTPRYISFDQLYFLRLSSIDDVFNTNVKIATIFAQSSNFSFFISSKNKGK